MTKLSIDLKQTFREDEFKGDINVEEISLPLLTTIPSSLFSNLQKLRIVNLNSTSTMQDGSFKNCISLEKVELPQANLMTGDSHFDNCVSLKNADLSGLKTVDQSASNIFNRCNFLTEIKLGDDPPNLFNENIFVNAGVVPKISIHNPNSWNNYFTQCTVDPANNHYLWYDYDTGLEKIINVCPSCPKNQKIIVIVLAVLTAVLGAGCIGLIIALTILCCRYNDDDGLYP